VFGVCKRCSDWWGRDSAEAEKTRDCKPCVTTDCIGCSYTGAIETCYECGNGKSLQNGVCKWPNIPGCMTYKPDTITVKSDGSCIACMEGYWLDEKGKCQECGIEGCTKCIKS